LGKELHDRRGTKLQNPSGSCARSPSSLGGNKEKKKTAGREKGGEDSVFIFGILTEISSRRIAREREAPAGIIWLGWCWGPVLRFPNRIACVSSKEGQRGGAQIKTTTDLGKITTLCHSELAEREGDRTSVRTGRSISKTLRGEKRKSEKKKKKKKKKKKRPAAKTLKV